MVIFPQNVSVVKEKKMVWHIEGCRSIPAN
jgi:hypothetical protein